MNSLQFLPKDLENIILDFKYQLEHTEKSKKYLIDIKKMYIDVDNNSNHYFINYNIIGKNSFETEICKCCHDFCHYNPNNYKITNRQFCKKYKDY